MLDLKLIREQPDAVKQGLKHKGGNANDIDTILDLDSRRRQLIQDVEALKQERNQASQQVGALKKKGEDASEVIERTRVIGQEIKTLDEQLKAIQEELDSLLDRIPNLPHESVPVGKSAEENVVIKAWGKIPEFEFEISGHMEIGERLDIIDFPRGSKISGRGFPVMKGAAPGWSGP